MTDVMTTLREAILHRLTATGGEEGPQPPSSYFMANIEVMAMSVFDNNLKLARWVREQGLDPRKGPDAVLGLGLMLVLDAEKNPRPEPSADDDADFPEDHHH